jgi:hypothetical protein
MKFWGSMFSAGGRKTGLVFVRERGLELEVWDSRPQSRWSAGVLCHDSNAPTPGARVELPSVSEWVVVLPTYACTTRYVWLPAARPDEIAAMLEFELPRIVPCSTQCWTWDYSLLGERGDGGTEVLVFLCPLPVVESALQQVHALGIEPRLVTTHAALHAARLAHRRDMKEPSRYGCVWWDHSSVDFFAMAGRKLVFLRGARVSGSSSQGLEAVKEEVERSLSLLRKQAGWSGILPLHVDGVHTEIPHLVARLKQAADLQMCAPSESEPSGRGPALAHVLRPGPQRRGYAPPLGINLLPQDRKERIRRTGRRRQIAAHALQICLGAVLLLACLRTSLWRTTRVLDQCEQRLVEIAPLAQKLQFLQSQLHMIQTQVQGSVSMLHIIGQLYQVLPPDVTVHYLSIDQRGQVVIRAQAKRLSQAFDCIDPLERSEYLANVRQNYAHLREMEGQVLIDFELRADLEKPMIQETGT